MLKETLITSLLIVTLSVSCVEKPSPRGTTSQQRTQAKACPALTGSLQASGFPEVKLLAIVTNSNRESQCTGTAVGDNVVLTAAHCVTDIELIGVIRYDCDGNKVPAAMASEIIFDPTPVPENASIAEKWSRDLAFLIFNEKEFDESLPIAENPASAPSALTVIGYSNKQKQMALLQYDAFNDEFDPYGTYVITNSKHEKKHQLPQVTTLIESGDSGGPILFQNEVVAISSASTDLGQTNEYSWFAATTTPFAKSLIQRAESAGARFNRSKLTPGDIEKTDHFLPQFLREMLNSFLEARNANLQKLLNQPNHQLSETVKKTCLTGDGVTNYSINLTYDDLSTHGWTVKADMNFHQCTLKVDSETYVLDGRIEYEFVQSDVFQVASMSINSESFSFKNSDHEFEQCVIELASSGLKKRPYEFSLQPTVMLGTVCGQHYYRDFQ